MVDESVKNTNPLERAASEDFTTVAPWESTVPALQAHMREITPIEKRWAEIFVLCNNKARAFQEAFNRPVAQQTAYNEGCKISHRPWVRAYVRELERARAQAIELDVQAIVEHDLAIVEASKFAGELTRYIWRACRYCHGAGFRYQWIDENEFAEHTAAAYDAAVATEGEPRLPTDEGGYGFSLLLEPIHECTKCGGLGERFAIIADTTRLEGPVVALFRGIKETKAGIEVLTHDVDKAKERLLRIAGAFKDDAASVARGAAAGAAAGSAIAAAQRAEAMTAEQAARLYLEVMD